MPGWFVGSHFTRETHIPNFQFEALVELFESRDQHGAAILDISKILAAFRTGTSEFAMYLAPTSLAGRMGILLSALRGFGAGGTKLSAKRLKALYVEAGLSKHEFASVVLPWLTSNGIAYETSDTAGESVLVPTIITYGSLLVAVADFFDSIEQDDERDVQVAVHAIHALCSSVPRTVESLRQHIAVNFDEHVADLSIQLSKAFRIVTITDSPRASGELAYTERVWADLDMALLPRLLHFKDDDRAFVQSIVERVRDHQGLPKTTIDSEAAKYNKADLLAFAIRVGLLAQTAITVSSGDTRFFLTTPHFYLRVRDEFGDDVCDRVKLFLDSIRNGQHFGRVATGRIHSPAALLSKFIDTGYLEGNTAIATDYTMAERAGIVRVNRGTSYRSNRMEIVQRDVVEKTLEIISSKEIRPRAPGQLVPDATSGRFVSIQETRAYPEFAEINGFVAEAEQDILKAIREGK